MFSRALRDLHGKEGGDHSISLLQDAAGLLILYDWDWATSTMAELKRSGSEVMEDLKEALRHRISVIVSSTLYPMPGALTSRFRSCHERGSQWISTLFVPMRS